MAGFTDIHCHILPGIDDGPADVRLSVEMLEIARADGIEKIVASPHILDGVFDNTKESIASSIAGFRSHLEAIGSLNGVTLCRGADIRICRDMQQRISNDRLPLINDKNYILLELPSFVIPPLGELANLICGLRMSGITAIITHPERNIPILEDLRILEKFVEWGAISQITGASITGVFGARIQKASLKIIKKGLAHVVATDAHNSKTRPPVLSGPYARVAKKFGQSLAEALFIVNPSRIVDGCEVDCTA
ncbi:MAG: hypothetical protein M0Z59_01590 [Nitrospiraceae bacterium]|nr:hypothetical protein [Nitrospiraceae bacterium]